MPFRSKAQQRFMFAAESRGELKRGTARRWADETKSIKKLPEKVAECMKCKKGERCPTHGYLRTGLRATATTNGGGTMSGKTAAQVLRSKKPNAKSQGNKQQAALPLLGAFTGQNKDEGAPGQERGQSAPDGGAAGTDPAGGKMAAFIAGIEFGMSSAFAPEEGDGIKEAEGGEGKCGNEGSCGSKMPDKKSKKKKGKDDKGDKGDKNDKDEGDQSEKTALDQSSSPGNDPAFSAGFTAAIESSAAKNPELRAYVEDMNARNSNLGRALTSMRMGATGGFTTHD